MIDPTPIDPLWRSSLKFAGREAIEAQQRANTAQTEADEAATRLRAALLHALGCGIDLDKAVRASGIFGDAEGPLNINERHLIAEQLEKAVKEIAWPPGIEIPEGPRPGTSWTYDGGGTPPDGAALQEVETDA